MLILTRRPVETIYIGEEVTVTVLGVVGNQVRFGIEAPRHITIDRAEIHERKKRAAMAGSGNPPPRENGSRVHAAANGHELAEETAGGDEHGNDPYGDPAATLKLRR